jgi:hypothetical protein
VGELAEAIRVELEEGAGRCPGRMVQNLPYGCGCLRERHAVLGSGIVQVDTPLLGALQHERSS